MGENKKYRTKAEMRRRTDRALMAYSKEQIEQHNFEKLVKRGVIREER
jgi:hypothetical protein